MNKKMIVGVLAGTIALGGAVGVGAMTDGFQTVSLPKTTNNIQPEVTATATAQNVLSVEEAKKLALEKYEGTVESIELDWENGRQVYDIDINAGNTEYDIDLDAVSGEFVRVKEDRNDDFFDDMFDDSDDDSDDRDVNQSSQPSADMIGSEKAGQIATEAYEGTIESIELEWEDGRQVYSVDMENGATDYDLDIDAATGEFVKVDEDRDDDERDDRDDSAQASASGLITEQEAIEIAKKAAPGTVTKVERDEDDGRYEYEIELQTDKGEADVKIDAQSGNVLEVDHDND